MVVPKKTFLLAWLVVVWVSTWLHAGWLKGSELELISLCLFKNLTGFPCPGCGMGHSLIAAVQGNWRAAWRYHPLGIPFFALWSLAVVASLSPSSSRSWDRWVSRWQAALGYIALGLVSAVYVLRHVL